MILKRATFQHSLTNDNAAAFETSMERYREIKSETKKNNIA